MQKSKLLHKLIFVVLTISMTFIIFTGCKNSASNTVSAQQASGNSSSEANAASGNPGRNSDEMKKKIEDTINSLVSAGTINSDQGTKIIETLTTRPNNSNGGKKQPNSNNNTNNNNNENSQNNRQDRQNFNPLSKLVEDKTITQEQADTVMNKLRENGAFGFGRNNTSNGGRKPADNSNNNQQSNSSSAQ